MAWKGALQKLLGRSDVQRPDYSSSPIVVGATGGSGTRAVHGVLARAGVFMGVRLNGSGDAMDFVPFLDEIINPTLERTRSLNYELSSLPSSHCDRALSRLREISGRYLADRPVHLRAWGWKNPRSIYILPFIYAVYPGLRFVHVVRDGRDMALSSNQNQLRQHYAALFGRAPRETGPVESIELWTRANLDVAAWGEAHLAKRYLRVRLEDLCTSPATTVEGLLATLRVEADPGTVAGHILPPKTLGRWRSEHEQLIEKLDETGRVALKAFGYL